MQSNSQLQTVLDLFVSIPLVIRKKAIKAAELYAELCEDDRETVNWFIRQSIADETPNFGSDRR